MIRWALRHGKVPRVLMDGRASHARYGGRYGHCGAVLRMSILGVAGEVLMGARDLMDRLEMPIVLKIDGVVSAVEDTSGRRQVYVVPSGVDERGAGRGEGA